MSKERNKINWTAAGCPLSIEKEILAIREDIQKKSKHRGANLILIKAAYNEMRTRQGKVKRELKCGSRCMNDLNRQLGLWLNIHDKRTAIQRALCIKDHEEQASPTGAPKVDELVPVKDRRKAFELLEYGDLIAKVIEVKGEPRYLELKKENNNRLVKKPILIQELL